MKKKTNKIVALFLAVILSFSALPFTAFAGSIASINSDKTAGIDNAQNAKTEYSDTQIDAGNISTDVYLTVDNSDIIASVPTSIIMDGTPDENGNYIGKYSISATGDIAADKVVQIKPNNSEILLNQKGKNPKAATINQTETTFNHKELSDGIRKNGSVTVSSLTAGSWNAQTEFTLSIIDAPILDGYTALYEYDLSATNNDNVKAYYCVPNKNTIPIKQKTIMKSKAKSASASNTENSIIYNGVEYLLSDEDTLVISGNGKMKPNIQSELVDYSSFYKDIIKNYNVSIYMYVHSIFEYGMWYLDENDELKFYTLKDWNNQKDLQNVPDIAFAEYGLIPLKNSVSTSASSETVAEIEEFCSKNYINYAVSTPKTLIVKNGVENISNSAFRNCLSLENVIIENGVKTIEAFAFDKCENLKNITIPESVTELQRQCFSACKSLKRLDIPNSVTEIGANICSGCVKLEYFKFPKEIDKIMSSPFSMCYALTEVIMPKDISKIPMYYFADCKSLKRIICANQSSADLIGTKSYEVIVAPEYYI